MLTRYGHIDAIPADAGEWAVKVRGASGLARSLAAQYDDALLYRRLATLRLDAPLPEKEPGQLQWRGVRQPDLADLCRRLGLESLLNRLPEPAGG